jgi:hypothetical protein
MLSISTQPIQNPSRLPKTAAIDIASEFQKTFELPGKDARTVSNPDKLQALVLLERITNPIQTGPIEIHQDSTLSLQNIPRIPCINTTYSLTETLQEALAAHPQIKARLCRSIEQWKRQPITTAPLQKSKFIERDDKKETISLTKNTVIQRQVPRNLGQKYDDKSTLFDPSLHHAIDSDYADIDHMDPWSKIVQRMQTCTDFINTFPQQKVKIMLQKTLKKEYPDFFVSSGTDIQPTQYLMICLYNHTDNLLGINHPGNIKKNDTAAIPWLTHHTEFGAAFVSEISTTPLTPNQTADPTAILESITNQSGLILKLAHSTAIKPEYQGRGLAYAAGVFKKKQTLGGEASIETQRLHDHMKSVALIKATGRIIGLLALMPQTEQTKADIQSLKNAIEKFNTRLSKSRKRAANQLREDILTRPSVHAIAGKEHQLSSSDSDDSTEVKLKRTQADLDIERIARLQERDARIQADHARIQERDARIQADHARIQERDARIQADHARIQAERDRDALIQEMRNDGVPETTIDRILKKAKTDHKDPLHG